MTPSMLPRSSQLDELQPSGPLPRRMLVTVAVGAPGVIDLFETGGLERIGVIPTEKGAHTLGFHAAVDKVYAFLPESHSAAVYVDNR